MGRYDGARNSVIGYQAMYGASGGGGSDNTVIGFLACGATTADGNQQNTVIGSRAAQNITNGDNNVVIGHYAGNYTTNLTAGELNILIGNYAHTSATNGVAQTVIGYNVASAGNNTTTIGKNDDEIETAHGSTGWATVSDSRVKENVVNSTTGLTFVNALRPVTFKFKKKKNLPNWHGSYTTDETEGEERIRNDHVNTGFLAQEVKAVIDATSYENDELWRERDMGSDKVQKLAPTALIPILVKALQEADDKIDALTARVTTLEG